jgi:hypothetical protein
MLEDGGNNSRTPLFLWSSYTKLFTSSSWWCAQHTATDHEKLSVSGEDWTRLSQTEEKGLDQLTSSSVFWMSKQGCLQNSWNIGLSFIHLSLAILLNTFFISVNVESLQSHFILTMSHWSSGLPICFLSQGTQNQITRGVLMWNQDSPVSVVSLHWWPRCDWSLWSGLSRASSQTVTRPSCQQCDNPTYLAQLFWPGFTLAAGPPSGFTTDIVGCRSPVKNLQSHCIHKQSHWSSG